MSKISVCRTFTVQLYEHSYEKCRTPIPKCNVVSSVRICRHIINPSPLYSFSNTSGKLHESRLTNEKQVIKGRKMADEVSGFCSKREFVLSFSYNVFELRANYYIVSKEKGILYIILVSELLVSCKQ